MQDSFKIEAGHSSLKYKYFRCSPMHTLYKGFNGSKHSPGYTHKKTELDEYLGDTDRYTGVCIELLIFYYLKIEVAFHYLLIEAAFLLIEVVFHFPQKLRLSSVSPKIEVVFNFTKSLSNLTFTNQTLQILQMKTTSNGRRP